MQLDRQSAVILDFPRAHVRERGGASGRALDGGRSANLALMLVVLGLAALWLAFPPPLLSGSAAPPAASLAQNLPQSEASR